jgi:hypothetical protein
LSYQLEELQTWSVNLVSQFSPNQPEMSAFGLPDGEVMSLKSALQIPNNNYEA